MHLGTRALRERGHEVFLAHGMAEEPETLAQYRYSGAISVPPVFDRNSKLPPDGLAEAEARLHTFIQDQRIDVLHAHTYPRTNVLGRLIQSYPVVVYVHCPLCPNGSRYLWTERCACNRVIGPGCFTVGYLQKGCGHLGNGEPMGMPGFVRGMWEDSLLRRTLKGAARLVANSHYTLERLAQDGFPREILRMVYCPVVVGKVNASEEEPVSPPMVTFVGRLVNFKGADQLVRASARITAPHQVCLVGDGDMRPSLEALVQELGIADRIRFLGSLPPDAIGAYRRQSAVVVVPSLWPEPFGLVGPEAMLMKRPVVANRVGGIPEWLKDGETGILVEPGDVEALAAAINRLLIDPELARTMGEAGYRAAQQWLPERHGENILRVYEEAIQSKAGSLTSEAQVAASAPGNP